jgi:hypothetical protein
MDPAPQLPGNTLVLIGQKEDVMPNEAISAFPAALAQASCVKVALYRSGYLMLLRDLKANVALGDLAAWMANLERTLPSGADRIKSTSKGSGAPAPLAVNYALFAARP